MKPTLHRRCVCTCGSWWDLPFSESSNIARRKELWEHIAPPQLTGESRARPSKIKIDEPSLKSTICRTFQRQRQLGGPSHWQEGLEIWRRICGEWWQAWWSDGDEQDFEKVGALAHFFGVPISFVTSPRHSIMLFLQATTRRFHFLTHSLLQDHEQSHYILSAQERARYCSPYHKDRAGPVTPSSEKDKMMQGHLLFCGFLDLSASEHWGETRIASFCSAYAVDRSIAFYRSSRLNLSLRIGNIISS